MLDMNKYSDIYKDLKNLDDNDFVQLIIEAKTNEEKEFYTAEGNYFCRKSKESLVKIMILLMWNNKSNTLNNEDIFLLNNLPFYATIKEDQK